MSDVDNLLDRWVSAGLSVRASKALTSNGIRRVSDMTPLVLRQLERTPGVGAVTLVEIMGFLSQHTDHPETSMSDQNSNTLPERAIIPTGDGFTVALRDGPPRFQACPGIKSWEEAEAQNKEWGVTPDQASELFSHVLVAQQRAAVERANEAAADAQPVQPPAQEEPCCEEHAQVAPKTPYPNSVPAIVVFAATFFSSVLGIPANSIGHNPDYQHDGMILFRCEHGALVAEIAWSGEEVTAIVYEEEIPQKAIFQLLGYCSYHEIDAEAQ